MDANKSIGQTAYERNRRVVRLFGSEHRRSRKAQHSRLARGTIVCAMRRAEHDTFTIVSGQAYLVETSNRFKMVTLKLTQKVGGDSTHFFHRMLGPIILHAILRQQVVLKMYIYYVNQYKPLLEMMPSLWSYGFFCFWLAGNGISRIL
jgi:hypothetical protein